MGLSGESSRGGCCRFGHCTEQESGACSQDSFSTLVQGIISATCIKSDGTKLSLHQQSHLAKCVTGLLGVLDLCLDSGVHLNLFFPGSSIYCRSEFMWQEEQNISFVSQSLGCFFICFGKQPKKVAADYTVWFQL